MVRDTIQASPTKTKTCDECDECGIHLTPEPEHVYNV